MARTYRPRPYQQRTCAHCKMHFETNHSRTKYCGDSCRVKAFYARQPADTAPTRQLTGNLSFSLPNLAVATTGATGAALLNYLINDRPNQQHILNLLESVKKGQVAINLKPLSSALNYLVDFVAAQVNSDPGLGLCMQQARQERLNPPNRIG